jgi:hypothetical protein
MSAHYGAPGFGRPQLATPSHTASSQGSAGSVRSGGAPVVRRKALFVAAATLCAPALAAVALAAIGATGGGGQAGMGSLAAAAGLRGTTTPAVSSTTAPAKHGPAVQKSDASESPPLHHAKQPAAPAPSPSPGPIHRRPAPAPKPHAKPAPETVTPPSLPTYDPTGPGAPTASSTTSGTSTTDPGTTTSGSGSSSNHGGGGTADGSDAYSGSPGGG